MEYVIDKRPILIVILSRFSRYLAFAVIAAIFLYILQLPQPTGLTPEGKKVLAVFALCVPLWVFTLLPPAVTGLLAITLIPLLGIMDTKKAYSLFGNEAVFFILGAFILGASVMKSGISTRISLLVLNRFATSPRRLLISIFIISAIMSFFISEHAVAAFMFPTVMELAKSCNPTLMNRKYSRNLMLSLSWGCIIGGIATFLGGARTPLAIGILYEMSGVKIGFFEWITYSFPAVASLSIIALVLILKSANYEGVSINDMKRVIEEKIKQIGRMGMDEKFILLILLLTVIAWSTYGHEIGLANISFIASISLFIFKLIRWKDLEEYVNWGVILMYGGAICLGKALETTGAASWLAQNSVKHWISSPHTILIFLIATSMLLTEAMSNASVVAVLLPIGINLFTFFGFDVRIATLLITLSAGLAFMLPVGTPANAIVYSSGLLRISDMARLGFLMNIMALAIIYLAAKIYWPLLGLQVN